MGRKLITRPDASSICVALVSSRHGSQRVGRPVGTFSLTACKLGRAWAQLPRQGPGKKTTMAADSVATP
jgi:hypothetical protein